MKYQALHCKKEPKRSYVSEYIYQRTNSYNDNFMGAFVGGTGSGKSISSLAIAEQIDPEFSIDNVAFSTNEFMQILNKFQELYKIGINIKGKVVIFDEVQISQSSRDFMRKNNKLMNFILSTFRNMNLVVFFTLPSFNMLDSQSRALLHGFWQSFPARNKEFRLFNFRLIEPNAFSGKLYLKKLRVYQAWAGRLVIVNQLKIFKPSRAIMNAYEEKKRMFTEKLNASVARDVASDST